MASDAYNKEKAYHSPALRRRQRTAWHCRGAVAASYHAPGTCVSLLRYCQHQPRWQVEPAATQPRRPVLCQAFDGWWIVHQRPAENMPRPLAQLHLSYNHRSSYACFMYATLSLPVQNVRVYFVFKARAKRATCTFCLCKNAAMSSMYNAKMPQRNVLVPCTCTMFNVMYHVTMFKDKDANMNQVTKEKEGQENAKGSLKRCNL